MSKTLFVSAVASLMLLAGCVREGSGSVAMRGPVDAATVHHGDAVPATSPASFETRQTAHAAPVGEPAPRRSNVRPLARLLVSAIPLFVGGA